MFNHLTGFFVYMLAMVGLILIAFIAAKKAISISTNKATTGFLKLEGVLPLEPRKSVYLIKAGSERFLVSSDLTDLKFLTKLDNENIPPIIEENEIGEIREGQKLQEFPVDQLFNFNDPKNPLCNMLKNLINRK